MGPLTEAQRKFAEENHDLIYAFLHRSRCDVSEYYDVAALGFLRAVQRYLTQPGLRKYAFPTIAWQAMGRAISKDYHRNERRREAERLYLETRQANTVNLHQEAESRLILHEMFTDASQEQYQLARLRMSGYSIKEAAQLQGLPPKQAGRLLTDLREICSEYNI